jgi:ribonuclease BN (tRNA processing enzyme)
MELTVLGASPALPNPGGASAGYLLRDADTTLLIDCGHGVVSVLRSVLDVGELSAIVISSRLRTLTFSAICPQFRCTFRRKEVTF